MTRRGVTLIELMVVLLIIGVMLGVVGFSFNARAWNSSNAGRTQIANARREAIIHRRPVRVLLADSGGARAVVALPDGSVIGAARLDSTLRFDRLTGRPAPTSTHAR